MKRTSLLFACLVLVFGLNLPAAGNAQAAPRQHEIESAVQRAMEEFQVPGMAVSVVYDGAVYYSAGHGLVETGKTAAVDDRTLFQIASSTASTTARNSSLIARPFSLNRSAVSTGSGG